MTLSGDSGAGTFASATVTVLPPQLEDLGPGQAKHGSFLSDGHSQRATPPPALQTQLSLLGRISRHLSFSGGPLDPAAERAARISSTNLDNAPFTPTNRPRSAIEQFVQSLGDTFLIARLTLLLWSWLGPGGRWLFKLVRLLAYTCLLLPGFMQMAMFYFGSSRVLRSISYGPKPRNRLDLFVPRNHWRMEGGPRAVVIYITGGAWMIGYKAWGSLLGRRLSKQGVLVCCLDYRNFPQGTIADMLEDVNTGIAWVLARCHCYGGDPARIYLVGQSCGAQLGTLALITQAEQEAHGIQLPGGQPVWSPQAIKGLVGVSGVYNCCDLAPHFDSRGLNRSLYEKIMSLDGCPQLKLLSPTYCVKGVHWGNRLPSVTLLHGTADTCAPVDNATQFAEALREAGAEVSVRLYDGETHTSPLIENPMRGGTDELTDDILALVTQQPGLRTRQFPLCPAFLISLAAIVCPF